MPGLVVPQRRRRPRRQPAPAQVLLHGDVGRRRTPLQRRCSTGAAAARPSVNTQREAVEQQIGRRGGCARSGAARAARDDLEQAAGARQPPGEQRRAPRVEVGLAREPRVERLERVAAAQQQRRRVAAAARGERDLARAAARPGRAASSSSGPASRCGQQPERGVERAGLEVGLRRGQRALGARGRVGASARPRARRNAAAAASPPRACARPAERSSSAATSSSGPAAACARCQARRSGSSSGSVDLGQRAVHAPALASRRRSVDRRAHERMAEPDPRADVEQPGSRRGLERRARDPEPRRRRATPAAGRRRARPPRPAAAAASPRAAPRAAAGSSPRSGPTAAAASGSPNPPASCAAENPRGSSSSASGLPRVSATIRSRTRSSSRPGTTVASSARASSSARPCERAAPAGRRARAPSLGSRTANTIATDSASSRRATNPRTWREAPSSHWASSTKQSSGCSSATSASRLSAAERDQEAVGRVPGREPERDAQSALLGLRKRVEPAEQRRAELMQPGERQLHLGLDPGDLRDPESGGPVRDMLAAAPILPTPGFAPDDQDGAVAVARVFQESVERFTLAVSVAKPPEGLGRHRG